LVRLVEDFVWPLPKNVQRVAPKSCLTGTQDILTMSCQEPKRQKQVKKQGLNLTEKAFETPVH